MRKLNQMTGMPQMKAAFSNWMTTITLAIVTQNVVNGFIYDTTTVVSFKGVIQPLSPEQIQLKPDGQRSWPWLQIHCVAGSLNLVTNDIILYNDVRYKVMAVKDYSLNNFIEYHVIKDYEFTS